MSLALLLCFLILHTNGDYLPHSAVPLEPATLGGTSELRCSKIVHRFQYDYGEMADCVPSEGNRCRYRWAKNGVPIDDADNTRYKIKNFYSYEYCAVTPNSEIMAAKLGLESSSREDGNVNDDQYSMSCYNSVLTITDVTIEDLGVYNCSLSDPSESRDRYAPDDYWTQNITLYDRNDVSVKYPKAIEYYETITPWNANRFAVIQCVTTGAPVIWKARIPDSSCERWQTDKTDPCEESTWFDLDDLKKRDMFLCFDYNYRSSAHPTDLYGESIIMISDISCSYSESIIVYCVEDEKDYKPSSWGNGTGTSIEKYSGRYDDWGSWYWRRIEHIVIPIILIPIVLGLAFIAALILSSIRGQCCHPTQQRVIFSPVTTFQQVAPQQQYYQVHPGMVQQPPPQQVVRPKAWPNQPATVGIPPYQPPATIDAQFCPS